MKFIVAPDKFKGSMSALEAANIISRGIEAVWTDAEILQFPLSDGGEGLVESLCGGTKGAILEANVTGPLGERLTAQWGMIKDEQTAVIEMSAASGLALVPENKRNPLVTTTYGTGELVQEAIKYGCSKIIVGIGGSATNDGGAGMAQALGAKLLDQEGKDLGFGGAELTRLTAINTEKLDPRLKKIKVIVASDVNNPLTGPQGSSQVYGPQKGASENMVELLDEALTNYGRVIKRDLSIDVDKTPGAGAAGGLGAGLIAFLNAELKSGIEMGLDALHIDKYLENCDLLITGEGRLDAQSIHGKAPIGVARRARCLGVPVIALSGMIEGDPEVFHREGIEACFAIAKGPLTLKQSIKEGPFLLENQVVELMRLVRVAIAGLSFND